LLWRSGIAAAADAQLAASPLPSHSHSASAQIPQWAEAALAYPSRYTHRAFSNSRSIARNRGRLH